MIIYTRISIFLAIKYTINIRYCIRKVKWFKFQLKTMAEPESCYLCGYLPSCLSPSTFWNSYLPNCFVNPWHAITVLSINKQGRREGRATPSVNRGRGKNVRNLKFSCKSLAPTPSPNDCQHLWEKLEHRIKKLPQVPEFHWAVL